MEVNVVHSLAGKVSDVCDHTVAICKALLFGQFGNDGVNMADQRFIFLRDLGGRSKMLRLLKGSESGGGAWAQPDNAPVPWARSP